MSTVKHFAATMAVYLEIQELSKKLYSHARKACDEITEEDVKSLGYDEVKLLKSNAYMANDDTKLMIQTIYNEKRRLEHPECYGVIHYPEIKEIDFLDEIQKENIDKYLHGKKKGAYLQGALGSGMTNSARQLYDFLVEKRIIGVIYHVMCECGDGGEYLTKAEYETWLEELEKPYHERDNEYLCLNIGCFDCEGFEVMSADTLRSLKKITKYRKIKNGNSDFDNI